MPATYLLATDDPELLRAWWVLVPAGRPVVTLDSLESPSRLAPGSAMVVVADVLVWDRVPAIFRRSPVVVVGEPGSSLLERARAAGDAKVVLGYEESRHRLAVFLPLLDELAEKGAGLELAIDRERRPSPPPAPVQAVPDAGETAWYAIDALVARIGERAGLVDEFRRLMRVSCGVGAVTVFVREGHVFRSDRGDLSCGTDDALARLWEDHPVLLDGETWPSGLDVLSEVALRQRMRQWRARLLVPLHDNGSLSGFLALGVRDCGEAYGPAERARVVALARVFRQCLDHTRRLADLSAQKDRWRLAEQYLPNVLVLDEQEAAPKHVPAAVRGLIAETRIANDSRKLFPAQDQPYRATAGIVAEKLGVWVYWEDASQEVREAVQKDRAARLTLLHDIALTLNHELGNALMSLTALRHSGGSDVSPGLISAIRRDIGNLESMNRHLSSIPTFSEVSPEEADVRVLLREVARRTGLSLDTGGPSVLLSVVPKLVDFALESIIESIAENRPELGKNELNLRLRASGEGDQLTAQVLIKGPRLALEGIWPPPAPGDVPSQGRISVFVAKEIIRLHGGDIRANQTTLGTEISITLRSW